MVVPVEELDLEAEFVECVSQTSFVHDLVTKEGCILDVKFVFGVSNPFLKRPLHGKSVEHVADTDELVLSTVGRPDCHGALPSSLVLYGVGQVLVFVLKIFSCNSEHLKVALIAHLLPSGEGL